MDGAEKRQGHYLCKPNETEVGGKGQCSSMRNAHAYLMRNISSKKDCIADTHIHTESHRQNLAPYWAFWENSQYLSEQQNNCLQQAQMMDLCIRSYLLL